MSALVFAAVLVAAAMHATWNAVIRLGVDRFASILLLALAQSGIAVLLLPFVPLPAAAAWPYVGSAALLHTGYKLFLIRAYAHGDLSQVYPLARCRTGWTTTSTWARSPTRWTSGEIRDATS